MILDNEHSTHNILAKAGVTELDEPRDLPGLTGSPSGMPAQGQWSPSCEAATDMRKSRFSDDQIVGFAKQADPVAP